MCNILLLLQFQETIGDRVWANMHDVISYISLYWGAVWVHNGWQGNIREENVCRATFPLKADKKKNGLFVCGPFALSRGFQCNQYLIKPECET